MTETTQVKEMMKVTTLRCEYWRGNALGIGERVPRLSWQLESEERGARQSAYQVLAASTATLLEADRGDVWDSGKVRSDQSIQVEYGGRALRSRERVYWKVRVWDEKGEVSAWSDTAWWEMGLLERSDWEAEWIAGPLVGGAWTTVPCPFLRKEFVIEKGVRQARLYVTALGLYECVINGQRVGDDVFAPGWTDYRKRVQYRVYDVSRLVQKGANVLGAILGDGWYCGHVEWRSRQRYGDKPKLLAQLEVLLEDGTRQVVCSDGSWRCAYGPILEADILMGESYDARRELVGWDRPGYDDRRWQAVEVHADPGIALEAQRGPVVKRMMELRPIADPVKDTRQWRKPKWVFDLGQNIAGRVRLRIRGSAGTTVTLRYAEMLNTDGTIYTANLRGAKATDHYTLRGDGEEVYEPRFTYHGFRYVELTGLPEETELTRDTVTGIVLYSEMEETGSFECSDELVNQLQRNIVWGQRGNYVDVPTDCPQRDERLGWTGDAQVFVRTAAHNMDVAGFFTKWLVDVEDTQGMGGEIAPTAPSTDVVEPDGGPGWADALIICAWTMYLCYGDKRILARHYEAMRRFMAYVERTSPGYIRAPEGSKWQGFGDWLSINADTPKDLIGTAFYAYSAQLMSEIAGVVGKERDAAYYQEVAQKVRAAFQRRFVTPAGVVASQTQTAYVLALRFGLLPEEVRAAAAAELVHDIQRRGMHLSTGFLGTPYLQHALSDTGHDDIAYKLLLQRTYPSWLYAVTQGATTIWERWDGWTHDRGFQDPGMNSFNHYAYGAVGEWLYRRVAGIDVDPCEPGYKHVIMVPLCHGPLAWACGKLRGPYGEIVSRWWWEEGALGWEVRIPVNSWATLFIPVSEGGRVYESNEPVEKAPGVVNRGWCCGRLKVDVGAGRYRFRVIDEKE